MSIGPTVVEEGLRATRAAHAHRFDWPGFEILDRLGSPPGPCRPSGPGPIADPAAPRRSRRHGATTIEAARASGSRTRHPTGGTMSSGKAFTLDEAREIGRTIGIDWEAAPFEVEQFRMGLDVELEHGARDPETNVTGDDPILTGKIALAHLREFPDYYTRLAVMEAEGEGRA